METKKNAPCFCGSGKKYKRCCLQKIRPNNDESLKKFENRIIQKFGTTARNGNLPQDEKLSQRILDLAKIAAFHNKLSVTEKLVNRVVISWNFAVLEKMDQNVENEQASLKKLLPDDAVGDFNEIINVLKILKNDLYPEDLRLVCNHETIEEKGQIRVNLASVPPETFSKGSIADIDNEGQLATEIK